MRPAALRVPEQSEILRARQVANLPHPPVVPPRLDPSATIANRFFERRSRRTIRAFGSPNTPRTVALARKPANEYPSDRRRCRFPDSAIAQRAEIERTSKLKKAPIHKLFRRYDPPKSPTRFPEDPVFRRVLADAEAGFRNHHSAYPSCPTYPTQAQDRQVEAGRLIKLVSLKQNGPVRRPVAALDQEPGHRGL